jgi:phosphopantetheine adenylyltransferase
MKIKNLNEAFQILKDTKEGIPFDAIKFIRNNKTTQEIIDKIGFSLSNAYNADIYYDKESDFYSSEPLWCAIIAEKHITKELIDPVINLYISNKNHWEYLNEQGLYLIGLLSEKFPNIVPEKVLTTIENEVKNKTKNIYIYLFDALYYIDAEKNKNKLLDLLKNENLNYLEAYVNHITDLKIKEAIPIIKEIIEKDNISEFIIRGLKYSLEQLETGKIDHSDIAKPYSKDRGDWESHYKNFEQYFYPDDAEGKKKEKKISFI